MLFFLLLFKKTFNNFLNQKYESEFVSLKNDLWFSEGVTCELSNVSERFTD